MVFSLVDEEYLDANGNILWNKFTLFNQNKRAWKPCIPPKVLETPIIPFDQSPIFNFKVCTLKTTHIISYFFELCKYFFQFPITL